MSPEQTKARSLLAAILGEIAQPTGEARTESFPSLRAVDAKVREVRLALEQAELHTIANEMERDSDFAANSRRVRLEALAHICRTALRYFDTGNVASPKKQLVRGPSLIRITESMPNLEDTIQARWLEAQRCQHAGAFLAAVILMGSILEALLLARALSAQGAAYSAKAAPRDRSGKSIAVPDWTLHSLIEVAVELRWLRQDRGSFSHALRQSRNLVHPYEQARSNASFDEATCKVCWQVLNASAEDLLS